jgi:predicted DNA-binding protein (UPF0251 family)
MPNAFEKVFSKPVEETPQDSSKMPYNAGNSDKTTTPVTGRPSAALVEAIRLMKEEGYTAHAAAKKAGIAISTIYRSAMYREMKDLPPYAPKKPEQND